MSESLARLGEAMQVWLRHCAAPDCTAEELLARHEPLRDLLEPLLAPAAAAAAEPRQLRFGDFRVERELGRGGMGVVYAAVQESLGRRVAVKVLDPSVIEAASVARFRRERELLSRLRHEHLLPVFEAGTTDDRPWFAMELVEGPTLAALLRHIDPGAPRHGSTLAQALAAMVGDPRAGADLRADSYPASVLAVVTPIAEALTYVHQNHVLHRDVKPANILLRADGTPLLADFGLARDLRDPSLTHPGRFAGTPCYMSPEQASGGTTTVDERTDVFSLGVVFYELLLLRRPFDGDTSEAVLEQVRSAEPPELRRRSPHVAPETAAVLAKALQKTPADRYATMAAFADDLRNLRAGLPVRAARSGWFRSARAAVRRHPARVLTFAVLVCACVAGINGVWLWSQRPLVQAARQARLRSQVEALVEEAALARHAGDMAAAAAVLAQASNLLPGEPELLAEQWLLARRTAGAQQMVAAHSALQATVPDVAAQAAVTLSRDQPSTALGWYVRGLLALDLGIEHGDRDLLQAAAAAARRAIDRAPAPRSAYHTLNLRVAMALGEWAQVRTMASDIEHLWAESPFAGYWCSLSLRSTDGEQAIAVARRAMARHPEHPALHAVMAQLLVDRDPVVAAHHAERALAARPQWASVQAIQVRALLGQQRVDAALRLAERALAADPDHVALLGAHARVLAHAERGAEAFIAVARAAELAPHAAAPWIHRAEVSDRLGDRAGALVAAQQAMRLESTSPLAWQALAVAQGRLGQHADAAAAFERVVEMAPGHAAAWHDLADSLRRIGQVERAEQAARRCIEVRPDWHRGHLQLGLVLALAGDEVAAEVAFRKAVVLAPDDAEGRLRLAVVCCRRGAFDEGLQHFAEARRLAPQIDQGWVLAAQALVADRRREEAVALLAEFVAQRPGSVLPRLEFVGVLLDEPGTDELARAARVLDEVERLAPGRSDVQFWRGELMLRRDQVDLARSAFTAAHAAQDLPPALRARAERRLAELAR